MTPPLAPRRLRHLVTATVALTLTLPLTAGLQAPSYAAEPRADEPVAPAATTAASRVVPDDRVRIPGPAQGRRAVRLLGDQLPQAAHANDMSADRLRELLLTDPTAMVDGTGRVLFADPADAGEADADPADAGEAGPAVAAATVPLAETFALHSKPGSQRTIFLDFDGTNVSNTQWNSEFGVTAGWHAGWDPARDGASFSDTERTRVQSIWARVAEDFAPFDVDVTTEDPGDAALTRSDSGDQVYGTRVLITGASQPAQAICQASCGGVAFMDVFDEPVYHARYQPAWVLTGALGSDTKSIAEAASHEAGHNLALDHDATTTSSYYDGHNGWAPIMGVGYSQPLVQWSRGGYAGADNTEDDLAIIAQSGAPLRADEAGPTVGAAAAALPAGPAYITADADQDVYALGSCRGDVSVSAEPAAVSPNLDISLELLDSSGSVRARANPLSAESSWDVMSGLSATLRTSLTSGAYYVRVDGTGNGTAATGYDGYGSIGAYTLAVTGCGLAAVTPDAPRDVVASAGADGRTATLAWSAPASDGGSAVTGYTLSRNGSVVATVAASTRSYTFRDLAPGTSYSLAVAAVSSAGTGPSAATTTATPTAPGLPTSVSGTRDAGTATLSWQRPTADGGSTLTGYQVRLDSGSWISVGATVRSHAFTGVDDGTHQLSVRAVNAVGLGAAAVVEVAAVTAPEPPTTTSEPPTTTWEPPTTPQEPEQPTTPTGVAVPTDLVPVVDALAGTAKLTWLAPATGTAGAVIGYQVLLDGVVVGGTAPGTHAVTVTGLARGGSYDLGVRALDSLGLGPVATVRVTLPGAPPAPERVTVGTRKGVATIRWQAPSSYDAALVTGWRVRALRAGVPVVVQTLRADARSWSYRPPRRTSTVLDVAAVSGDLLGAVATTVPVRTVARPSAPRINRARGDARADGRATALVTWREPRSTGGAPVQAYRVVGQRLTPTGRVLLRRSWSVAGDRSRTRLRLPAQGAWAFAVKARNSAGTGPASSLSNRITAR